MDTQFKKSILNHTKDFTAVGNYRTVTRKNGSEIITVADGKISLTRLNSELSKREIANDIPFQPIEILLNECEQLLCLYDAKNVWLFSLNKEGSDINFTVTYKVKLCLDKDENVLQVIFNNVSKFQSEIVILTTREIKSYNINMSLHSPVQRYDFQKECEKNTSSNSYDLMDTIIDPVSICFASCTPNSAFEFENTTTTSTENPQNDLTLFLLTSDASVYKIFPFFPYELSVSNAWLNNLFDSTSLTYNSLNDTSEQLQMMPTVKATALLAKVSNPSSIIIHDTLPTVYRKGKIAGPLSMESFPEELYAFEAIKLVSLPNDLLVIAFNHTVIVFHRNHNGTMLFENQTTEANDVFLLLDTIIFSPDKGDICTLTVHPVTCDSVFITASNGSLIHIDFSQWFEILSIGLTSGDLSEFNKLCQNERLPTEVFLLGKLKLTEEKPIMKTEVALRSHENNIWFAWNARDVYAMIIKEGSSDILSIFLISTSTDSQPQENNASDIEETVEKDENKYKSLLTGEFEKDILPTINTALGKITDINNMMKNFPTIILNEDKATTKELKAVYDLSEYVTSGQLILFRVLTILSERLRAMTEEYHNQLNTYHKITLRKQDIIAKFFRLKGAYEDAIERQTKLNAKMLLLMDDVEKLECKNNMKNISISSQENAYFKELAKIRDFTLKKETELENINQLLDTVKKAEKSVLLENKDAVLKNFHNRRALESFKVQLENQNTFINYLVERLAELSMN